MIFHKDKILQKPILLLLAHILNSYYSCRRMADMGINCVRDLWETNEKLRNCYLHCLRFKTRYFADSGIIGTKGFVSHKAEIRDRLIIIDIESRIK